MKILYGQTCAYKDIVTALQNAKVCRAVDTANSRNSFSIIVPCHRMRCTLGGYALTLPIKKYC
jgi:methylated-DNA-[protein]-cysteine S-methyltransferase